MEISVSSPFAAPSKIELENEEFVVGLPREHRTRSKEKTPRGERGERPPL
jgi:hypothetical protein